ncbi:hypothetical protein AND_005190 [Anopheles darlingi]|uniref:Uncharacterized protein n=1 Tax=Anopheles darlingi TaxID=43151 RepID=W5JJM9_ANODA|nr:hypothetical protein AND_005190 [Anopheles darlingi]
MLPKTIDTIKSESRFEHDGSIHSREFAGEADVVGVGEDEEDAGVDAELDEDDNEELDLSGGDDDEDDDEEDDDDVDDDDVEDDDDELTSDSYCSGEYNFWFFVLRPSALLIGLDNTSTARSG